MTVSRETGPVAAEATGGGLVRVDDAWGEPDWADLARMGSNDRRKFEAYGDIELPQDEDLDAQDTAAEVRAYFEAVEAVLGP